MTDTARYFYRKEDKLKSRKSIELLFAKGSHFSVFPFKVIWMLQNEKAFLQAGFAVSSRYFKKATDRNRIKRLMREAYRLQKNELQAHLQENLCHMSVFIVYTGKELPAYNMVYEKSGLILKKLIKLAHAKDPSAA